MSSTQPIDSAPSGPGDRAPGPLTDLELWAHCTPCGHWFSLPSDTIEAMAGSLCPHCDGAPDAFEERYGAVRFPIEIS